MKQDGSTVGYRKLPWVENRAWVIKCLIFLAKFRVIFKDDQNQVTLNRLLKEVKALNSGFLTEHIKGTRIFMMIN